MANATSFNTTLANTTLANTSLVNTVLANPVSTNAVSTNTTLANATLVNTVSPIDKSFQTLNIIVSSGRSKEFLGKNITVKELEKMTLEQIDAYYKIYELSHADKINDNIIEGIIALYSRAVNKLLPIDDVKKLSEDLNSDYILTSELKNITAGVAAVCGKLISVFSLGIITFKHVKVLRKEHDNEQVKELCNEQFKELRQEHDNELCKEKVKELSVC